MAGRNGRSPELAGRVRRRVAAQVRAEEPACWRCGLPIDLTLPRVGKASPWSSTIDEVIPRSRHPLGARYAALDRGNLRHAHRQCNLSRGNRMDHPKQPRSRVW